MKNNLLNPKGRREILEIIGTLPSQFQNSLRELLKQSTPTAENQEFYLSLAKTIQQSIQSGSLGRREFLQLTSLLTSSGLLSLVFPKSAHAGGIMPFGFWGAGARKTAASIDSIAAYRSLLLNGEGSIGALNAFLDSSSNQFSITKSGTPTQGTFSPFSAEAGKWSSAFNGSSDYYTVSGSSLFSIGTGDFTVEAWINPTSLPTSSFLPILVVLANYGLWFGKLDAGGFGVRASYMSNLVYAPTLPSLNTWTHIAATRSGTTIRIFYNGVQAASGTSSNNFPAGPAYVAGDGGSSWFPGQISNLRLIMGSALYTANFTPSTTPLTAVSGTALLTCQDSRPKDNSSNNYSFSGVGTPKVGPSSPFTATSATYSPAIHGGSAYFNGTTDYINLGNNSAYSVTGSSLTCEAWVYPTSHGAERTIFSRLQLSSPYPGYILRVDNGYPLLGSSSNDLTSSVQIPLYAWSHIAFVFDNTGNQSIYVNGIRTATRTNGPTTLDYSDSLYIGGASDGSRKFYGYISNARVIKSSTLIYSGASITLPTSPLTAVSNTSLLLNFTNADFIDNSKFTYLTPTGTPTQGSFSPFSAEPGKWGAYFDGSTAYIQSSQPTSCAFGTGNFTVEAWIYPQNAAAGVTAPVVVSFATYGTENGFWISIDNNALTIRSGGGGYTITSNVSITNDTWHHIAVTRQTNTLRLFLNGNLVGSTTWSVNCTAGLTRIGSPNDVVNNLYDWGGYISNLRAISGSALYTSNFMPPTSPLTAVSGTVLLTCQDNQLKDNSSIAQTLTPSGNIKIIPNSPFSTISTQYNAATHGGSAYLNGDAQLQYVSMPPNAYQIGNSNFSIEAWVYQLNPPSSAWPSNGAALIVYGQGDGVSAAGGSWSMFATVHDIYIGSTIFRNNAAINLKQWNHVVMARNGDRFSSYINGTRVASTTGLGTAAMNTGATTYPSSIGALGNDRHRMEGYISDVRMIIGGGCIDANATSITVPTAPLTVTPQTAFLCNFTNASTIDVTRKNNLLKIGDTQVKTSVKKFGNGSIYFDGSGDTLWIPPNNSFTFGKGPFTIECWFYYLTQAQVGAVLFDFSTTSNALGLICHCNLPSNGYPNRLTVWTNTYAPSTLMITGTTTLQTNTWYHMAITRDSSGVFRLFLNGQLEGSTYTNTADPNGTNYGLYVGGNINYNANRSYTGNIDQFTVVTGKALYTANFTPTNISGY